MPDEEPRHRVPLRRRRILKRVGIGVLALVMALSLAGVLYVRNLNANIDHEDFDESNRPPEIVVADGRPLNVLVMGSDTREGANGAGIGGETPGLSDTTMLLHISANRKFAYGVSLPRDAMVERPQCKLKDGSGTSPAGLVQFNTAYAIGGPACTVKTVEHLTGGGDPQKGIRIDHFLVVDFVGFRSMVNALKGVEICVPEAINDDVGHISLPAGTYKVTGQQALDYVRVRHGVGTGSDVGRMKRQQVFVSAMIKKVVSAGTLANPLRLNSFLQAATGSLTADPGVDVQFLASIGKQLKDIGLDKIQFITVPIQDYAPDPNRLQWAPDSAALWDLIKQDKRLGSRFNGDAVSPGSDSPSGKPTGTPSGTPTGNTEQVQEQQDAQARRDGICS